MTTVITAANNTAVTILESVSTVTKAISQTIGTAASSIDMLDAFVMNAKAEQAASIKMRKKTFINNLVMEVAREEREIVTELSSDEILKKLFDENLAYLNKTE